MSHPPGAVGQHAPRELDLARAKAIYRQAIDARASDHEGALWWEAVRLELDQVAAAPTVGAAAAIIAWWHPDWSMVGDTPRAAASRIRREVRAQNRRCAGTGN